MVDSSKDWCSLFARSEPNFYRQIQVGEALHWANEVNPGDNSPWKSDLGKGEGGSEGDEE